MKPLEEELRNALRREEPPEGFAGRVLAATAQTRPNSWSRILSRPEMRWAMAGALCLMLALAGMEFKQARREEARGEAAKAQLMQALHITASKLQRAQEKVRNLDASEKY